MTEIRHVGVIDIGKTNLKVAVVDLAQGQEVGVLTRPNEVLAGPPYPHFDLKGHWHFVCDALRDLHRQHRIDALSVTTHGASAVLLDRDGNLAVPMLDYEYDGPDSLAADYDALRPDFAQTGSPRLSMGLNLGAQLHWQLASDPELRERIATVLTYPQYWTYKLTGTPANEVTSLGCHTDLWCPEERRFSSLVDRLGLAGKMAPVKKAGDRLGTLLPAVAARTGMPADTPVACGIHDSNASLLPHLLERRSPFSVVSTGTWVIALAIGGKHKPLDPARDTLMNVNAFGDPVPSARFMGGREFDLVLAGRTVACSEAEAAAVLEKQIMLLPAVEPRSGPFQGKQASWNVNEAGLTDGERFAALSCYLAMVTAECLDMIGADGPVIVEGPFARNSHYLAMLRAATGRRVETSEASATGTSIGAALLVQEDRQQGRAEVPVSSDDVPHDPLLEAYADAWRQRVK